MLHRFARPLRRLLDILIPVLLVGLVLFFIARSWAINHVSEEDLAAEASVEQEADLSTIVSISCENGTETLLFHLDANGTWRWIDESFPLDSEAVAAFAETLKNFTPTMEVTSGENLDLESYGLSTPANTLSFTNAGGNTTTLHFGKVIDNGSAYMKYADNDATVYMAPAFITKLINQSLYDLCITDSFPALNTDTVSSFTLKGEEKELTYTRRVSDSGSVRWFCGSNEVTNNPIFLGMMEELDSLAYDACLVWNPVDASLDICGLEEPRATMTVEYADANQRECSLTLSIGDERSDTQYFSTWSAKNAIYSISRDAVDELLAAVTED